MRVIEQKLLYSNDRFHAAFPSIARLHNSQLLLAFRRARDSAWLIPEEKRGDFDALSRVDHIDSRSHIALLSLDAEGCCTPEPVQLLPVDPEAGDQDPSLLVLQDGRVLLASFAYYHVPDDVSPLLTGLTPSAPDYHGSRYLSWGSHVSLRDSEQDHWIFHHRYLPMSDEFGKQLAGNDVKTRAGATRGQPLEWRGKLLVAVYGEAHSEAALYASADAGNSWSYMASIARHPDRATRYQEPALCHDGQGGLLCFLRTAGENGGYLAISRSSDGMLWTSPEFKQVIGQPFHPLLLQDGRLLVTYGYRQNPSGIRALLLDSPQHDPDSAQEFIIRDDGINWDLGYPWSVELEDGRILVVYYMTSPLGIRQIWGSWLAMD